MRTPLSVHAGYYDLLEYTGLKVLEAKRFGDIKTLFDLVFAVYDPEYHRWGIVPIPMGPGRDLLHERRPRQHREQWDPEDLATVLTYASMLKATVHWGNRAAQVDKWLRGDGSLLSWYGHQPGYTEAVMDLLMHIPA
jgi:hypothetical protein